jgi:hypothetical protein
MDGTCAPTEGKVKAWHPGRETAGCNHRDDTTVIERQHAGGVLENSRWQAPKARRHRIGIATTVVHPGRGAAGSFKPWRDPCWGRP